jgi:hypothetical protein
MKKNKGKKLVFEIFYIKNTAKTKSIVGNLVTRSVPQVRHSCAASPAQLCRKSGTVVPQVGAV